jgi:hypothetical protein
VRLHEKLCKKCFLFISSFGFTRAVSVAPNTAATSTTNNLFCTFCKQPNHDLSDCNNVSNILKKHKEERHQEYLAKQKSSALSSKPNKSAKAKPPAKAGHTTVVELNNVLSSGNELQESDYEVSGAAAVALLLSRMSKSRANNFNLDSGCLISMTPFLSSLTSPAVNLSPVCLADSTLLQSMHLGKLSIPLGINTEVKTLVVPNLHEPLLLVAALWNEGLLVCFNASAC